MEGEPRQAAEAVTFALQRSYQIAKVCLDTLSASTTDNLRTLVNYVVSEPAQVRVIMTDDALDVPMAKTVENISNELRSANVDVILFSSVERCQDQGRKAVFVVTGHSSEALAILVHQLGEAGFFRHNLVVFNSCRTPLTRELVIDINGRYGAIGTYAFSDKIMAAAVQEYLFELHS